MAEQPTILLVEDDPAARRLFEEAIAEDAKIELNTATDGGEALELLSQWNGWETSIPDLIVLDLDLPKVDGMTVLKEYRASTTSVRRIPILILSENTDQAAINEAYEFGANAYLPKPDDYDELLSLIRELYDFWLDRVSRPSR